MSDYRWSGLQQLGPVLVTVGLAASVAVNQTNGNVFWDPLTAAAAVVVVLGVVVTPLPSVWQDRERRRREELEQKRVLYPPRCDWLRHRISGGCELLSAIAEGAHDGPTMRTLSKHWWEADVAQFRAWEKFGLIPDALRADQPSADSRDAMLAFLHPRVDLLSKTLREMEAELKPVS